MNISIISPQIYPCVIGGLEIFNYYLIQNLAHYYTLTLFSECSSNLLGNISILKVKSIPLVKTISLNIDILFKLLNFKNLDVLIIPYTSNSPLIYPVLLLNFLQKLNYIVVIHGGGMYPWKKAFFQKKLFLNAVKIIAVSEPLKIEYEKRTGKIIEYIPPLIPFKATKESKNKLKFKYGFGKKDLVISCIGSIKKIKGSDILLNGFFELGRGYIKKNNLKLIYVGDGDLKSKLETIVLENELSDNIKFLGMLNHDKIEEIYKMTDIYVIPSLFEGTPISLLEGMFNSITILGSDVQGINNIIEHGENGLLFRSKDSLDLKTKLKEIIENKEDYINLGLNAKNTYNHNFNYESMITSYKNIFESLKVKDV